MDPNGRFKKTAIRFLLTSTIRALEICQMGCVALIAVTLNEIWTADARQKELKDMVDYAVEAKLKKIKKE
jgi:hypothetical protein